MCTIMIPVLDTHMINWSNDLQLREANFERNLGNFRDMNMIPRFNTSCKIWYIYKMVICTPDP